MTSDRPTPERIEEILRLIRAIDHWPAHDEQMFLDLALEIEALRGERLASYARAREQAVRIVERHGWAKQYEWMADEIRAMRPTDAESGEEKT